jgi:hypothetical protein
LGDSRLTNARTVSTTEALVGEVLVEEAEDAEHREREERREAQKMEEDERAKSSWLWRWAYRKAGEVRRRTRREREGSDDSQGGS